MSDEQKILVELYKTHNYSKEEFINRNFATNRYYLTLTLFLLFAAAVIYVMTPSVFIMTVLGGIGIVTTILWLLNIDSYQTMIKVKYSKILERIEDKLPVQPYQDEYKATGEIKKSKKSMIFVDLQKGFVYMVLLLFIVIFAGSVAKSFIPANTEPTQPVQTQTVDLSEIE